jgi:hypothetical protein
MLYYYGLSKEILAKREMNYRLRNEDTITKYPGMV